MLFAIAIIRIPRKAETVLTGRVSLKFVFPMPINIYVMIDSPTSIQNGALISSCRLSGYDRQSVDVTFRTTEGDTVSLSLQNQTKATYEHLFRANRKRGLSSNDKMDISTEAKFAVSVSGDLNDEEMEDLSKAIRVVEKMNSEFLSGHGDKAIASQAGFADIETIESVDSYFTLDRAINMRSASSVAIAKEAKQGFSVSSAWTLLESLIRKMNEAQSSQSAEDSAGPSQSTVPSTQPVALVA